MTDVSKILNGLQPSATYTVQVRSKNSDGEYSDWSNSYTFSTPSSSITTYNSTVNTVLQGGSLIAGDLSNANVQINSAGIFGYTVGSVPVFSIPTDPSSSPTFAGFSLVQSGLTAVGGVVTSASGAISSKTAKIPLNAASSISSGWSIYGTPFPNGTTITAVTKSTGVITLSQATISAYASGTSASIIPNANIVVGTSASNNITIRGQGTPGQPGAIYSVINGNSTLATSGSGFYIDETGKFRFASSSSAYISGDGAGNLSITGSVVATAGLIGGLTLASDKLSASSPGSYVGISGSGNYAFWAGSANPALAPFSVTNTGIVTASNLVITNSVTVGNLTGSWSGITPSSSMAIFAGATASTGTGAAFWVTNTGSVFSTGGASFQGPIFSSGSLVGSYLSGTSNNSGSLVGGAILVPNSSNPTFKVDSSGNMTASNAYLSGSIISNSGSIGGWTIAPGALRSGSIVLSSGSNPKIYIGAGNSACPDTPFYVDSTGTLSLGNKFQWTGSALQMGDPVGSTVGFQAPVNPSASSIAIYAGSNLSGASAAPFRVDYSGNLTATNAYITGSISATSGSIGGFAISGSTLYGGQSGSIVGLNPYNSNAAIFAGATSSVGTNAKFWVTNSGSVYATAASFSGPVFSGSVNLQNAVMYLGTSGAIQGGAIYVPSQANPLFSVSSGGYLIATGASVSGSITATAGNIGNWLISSGNLTSGTGASAVGLSTGNYAFYAGNTIASAAPFSVTNTGNLTATNANIAGTISSTLGNIGGIYINSDSISAASSSTYATQILSASPRVFIQFETNPPIDSSSNNYPVIIANGTLYSTAGFNGIGRTLFSPSATNTSIQITHANYSGASADISIEFWISGSNTLAYAGVIGKNNNTITDGGWNVQVGGNNNDKYIYLRIDTDAAANQTGLSIPVFNDGKWHHVVYQITSGAVRQVFLDGSFNASATFNLGSAGLNTTSAPLNISSYINSGYKDQLAIYHRILTPTEILNNYNAGIAARGFSIFNNGQVNINNANISGNINATSGSIGGFNISGSALYGGPSGSIVGFNPYNASAVIFAGATSSAGTGATFWVSGNGNVYSSGGASFTGPIFSNASVVAPVISGLATNSGSIIGGAIYVPQTAPYKFIVDSSGNLTATSASISGSITSNSGNIGGWLISSGSLTSGIGASAVGLSTGNYAIYAGNATPSSAPFSVTNSGNLYAQNAVISGSINASSGTFSGVLSATTGSIGGFLISNNSLSSTGVVLSSSTGLNLGSGQFTVNQSGAMLAQNASVTGQITAGTGNIAGWTLTNQEIGTGVGANRVALNSSGSPKIYIGYGNYGTGDTGFYADSKGYFSLGNQLTFAPGKGTASIITTPTTFINNSGSITTNYDNTSSVIIPGTLVTASALPTGVRVATVTFTNPMTASLTYTFPGTTQTINATFQSDNLSLLTVNGTIRGAIDSVTPISSPTLFANITSASINAASTVLFTASAGHFFSPSTVLIFTDLPTTNNLNLLKYAASAGNAYSITSTPNSTQFTINYGGLSLTAGNVSASGRVSIQQLTMGLHPSEGIKGTDSWYHDTGTGVRLDQYNWWLVNNQFRVGNPLSYFKYDGSQFRIQGGNNYSLLLQVGANNATNQFAITSGSTGTYNNLNTPFYVDGNGFLSMGTGLLWDGANLTVNGNINVTGGNALTNAVASSTYATNVALNSSSTSLSGSVNSVSGSVVTVTSSAQTLNSQTVNLNTSGNLKGAMTVITGGAISAGKTNYNTGTGWWFDFNGGTPRLDIGNPAGNYMQWDGANLIINGQINITGGNAATTTALNTASSTLNTSINTSSTTLSGSVTNVSSSVNNLSGSVSTVTSSTTILNNKTSALNQSAQIINPMTVISAGAIGSGKTAYNTGSGWWLEYNSGSPRLDIGNPAGNYIQWDGANLTVNGTINVSGGNAATNSALNTASSTLSGSVGTISGSTTALNTKTADFNANGDLINVMTVIQAGAIAAGKTAYNTGTGWLMEYNSGSPRLDIGTTSNYLKFDGTNVLIAGTASISGSVVANAGAIGGWIVSTNTLSSGSINLISGAAPKIYIGAGTYSSSTTPFYVDNSGSLSLGNKLTWDSNNLSIIGSASISGSVVANSGQVGGWTIGQYTLSNSYINLFSGSSGALGKIYIGSGSFNNSNTVFYVDNSGYFSISDKLSWNPSASQLSLIGSASISGSIVANSGTIAGWTIQSGSLIATGASISGTGGLALGSPAKFTVNTLGDMVANSASINGSITSSVGNIGGWTLSNNSLSSGSVSLISGASAKIYIGAGTYSSSTTPFYVDNSGSLSIGNKLTWNGSRLLIGDQTGGTVGFQAPSNPSASDIAIYAGASAFSGASAAPFRVTYGGVMYATGASVSGSITASAGNIGGWVIAPNNLYSSSGANYYGMYLGTGNNIFFAGATDSSGTNGKFIVNSDGGLYATSASVSGKITATSGNIGGWTASSNYLNSGNVGMYAPVSPTSNEIAFFAGSAVANRASAPFRVDYAGNLYASSASISGIINATSGNVGPVQIGSNSVYILNLQNQSPYQNFLTDPAFAYTAGYDANYNNWTYLNPSSSIGKLISFNQKMTASVSSFSIVGDLITVNTSSAHGLKINQVVHMVPYGRSLNAGWNNYRNHSNNSPDFDLTVNTNKYKIILSEAIVNSVPSASQVILYYPTSSVNIPVNPNYGYNAASGWGYNSSSWNDGSFNVGFSGSSFYVLTSTYTQINGSSANINPGVRTLDSVPVLPKTNYVVSSYVLSEKTSPSAIIGIEFYDQFILPSSKNSTTSYQGQVNIASAVFLTSSTQWTRISASGTSSSISQFARVFIQELGNNTASTKSYFSGAQLEIGSSPTRLEDMFKDNSGITSFSQNNIFKANKNTYDAPYFYTFDYAGGTTFADNYGNYAAIYGNDGLYNSGEVPPLDLNLSNYSGAINLNTSTQDAAHSGIGTINFTTSFDDINFWPGAQGSTYDYSVNFNSGSNPVSIGSWRSQNTYTGLMLKSDPQVTSTIKNYSYLLMTNGLHTYISSASTGNVYIRPNSNTITNQISVAVGQTTVTGGFTVTAGADSISLYGTGATTIGIGNNASSSAQVIYLGYGTTTTNNNTIRSGAIVNTTTANAANMYIDATNLSLYRSTSSFKVKTNIAPLYNFGTLSSTIPSDKILNSSSVNISDALQIVPVSFTSELPDDSNKSFLGFIAEDVAEKVPSLATYDPDGSANGYSSNGMIAVLWALIQEQQIKIDQLSSSVVFLASKLS